MKILIYIQSTDEKINPISLESLVAAQKFKEKKGAEIYAVTFSEKVSNDLTGYDINEVIYVDNENLKDYNPLYFLETFVHLDSEYHPDFIVFGHTYETRDWVPRLSVRLDSPFLSDCIGMDIGDKIVFMRSLYQNKINVDLTTKSEKSIISFQSGSYKIDNLKAGNCTVNKIIIDLNSIQNKIINDKKFKESDSGVDLSSADFIVSIGRGIAKEENIPMVKELTSLIGAQLASSRPVVDRPWEARGTASVGRLDTPGLLRKLKLSRIRRTREGTLLVMVRATQAIVKVVVGMGVI